MLVKQKTSRNRSIIHEVPKNPHPKSYAAMLLLTKRLIKKDDSRRYDYDWRYWFIFRRTFLRHRKNENGCWNCHYCNDEKEMGPRGINGKNNKFID